MKFSRVAILVLGLIALTTILSKLKSPTTVATAADQSPFVGNFSLVDKSGNIAKPADYRDKYQTLGTYFVLDSAGNQMHNTYASPGAAEYFCQNGKFADGTVLVKEVFGTDHVSMTTGDAHWGAATKVWFVMMKDEKGRYRHDLPNAEVHVLDAGHFALDTAADESSALMSASLQKLPVVR